MSSDVDEVFSYVFSWHALSDACKKCQALNMVEWDDQDLFQNVLWDVGYGNIWDLNVDRSLAHPNCRCQLEVRVDVDITKIAEYNDFIRLQRRF